jgi:nucleotide-binding universal stress UspA family protein
MKKKIVVPIDFSAASLSTVNYAADFAIAAKADITLIHVYQFPINTEIPVPAELINQLIEDAQTNIAALKQNLNHITGNKINICTEVREGNVITQVEEYCEQVQPLLVIMGAHVTNATERIIFGSNTLAAVRNLSWPLIIVPNGARFKGVNNAGLACDLQDAPSSVHAEELKTLFSVFHSKIHILHVTKKKHGMLNEEEIKGGSWLQEVLAAFNPVFHYLQKENIEEAIKEFSEKNNLDLLVIIPKKHGLFNGLLHKSQSKQMIVNTHIPVMSIHE